MTRKLLATVASCALLPTLAAGQTPTTGPAAGATQQQTDASGAPEDRQRAQARDVGEVVVTARRRAERVQDVPIAVSAFSPVTLERQQVRNLEDLSQSVPNLNVTHAQASANIAQVFIRGVGQDDTVISIEPAIGLYVDGVPYVKAVGALLDLIEFDRIEVLRGPQGTLYGRNSTGGAVKFETKRPTPDAIGYTADATVGSFHRIDLRGAINLPLSSTAAFKLDLISRNDDGFIKNALYSPNCNCERDLNRTDRQSVRGSLLWRPSSSLSLFASADYTRDRSGPQTGVPFVSAAPADNLVGTTGKIRRSAPLYGYRLAAPEVVSPNKLDAYGGQVTAEYTGDGFTARSITGYRAFDFDQAVDTNGGPAATGLVSQNGTPITRPTGNNLVRFWRHRTFTEELQLLSAGSGPLTWVAGAFYMHERNRSDDYFGTFKTNAFGFNNRQTTKSVAIYGEASYKFFDALELTLGGRYTWDEKDYFRWHFAAFNLPIFSGSPYAGSTSPNWKRFTPRVVLKYKATSGVNLYASYAQGYQSGAFQSFEFVSAQRSNTPFNPTVVDTYEAGAKTEFFDRRLRLNTAVFYSKYRNIPASLINNLGAFEVTTNDVRLWGTEWEVQAIPVEGLTLYGQLSTLNDRYTKSVLAPSLIPGKNGRNYLKFAPDLKWKLGLDYAYATHHGTFSVGGNLGHTGSYYGNVVNTPFGYERGYTLLDAQVGYETPDGRWKLSVGGRNLTDRRYAPQVTTQGGGAVFYGAPRTFSVTLRVKS